jgi:N-methylhydantoinase A
MKLAVRDYLADRLPDVQIVMSHRVSPEWREFERTSTTVTDAYLAPVVRRYISTLQAEMGEDLPEGGRCM